MRHHVFFPAMLALALSNAGPALADDDTLLFDVFVGTLAVERGEVILTRCDIGSNRYVLRDEKGGSGVADYLKHGKPGAAEIVASYSEDEGRSILTVVDIGTVKPGDNCHLGDTLAALGARAEVPAGKGAAVVAGTAGQVDPAFVGHYYLSGVMETGSELMLRPDGRFDWYISYGSVDQAAKGTWARDGDAILLKRTDTTGKPLYGYLETVAWDSDAERMLLVHQRDWAEKAVRAACPFLIDPGELRVSMDATTVAPPMIPGRVATRATVEPKAAAAKALAEAMAVRTQVEALARTMMAQSRPARGDDAGKAMAEEALSAWILARDIAYRAAGDAGLPTPDIAAPVLPASCQVPTEAKEASKSPKDWQGGIGVRVVDLASHQGATKVRVTLRFADGKTETIVTARRGAAIRPGISTSPVIGVTLQADYAPGRDQDFTIAPITSGFVYFSIAADQLTEPVFTTLRLRIAGDALVPDAFGRGRYERQK